MSADDTKPESTDRPGSDAGGEVPRSVSAPPAGAQEAAVEPTPDQLRAGARFEATPLTRSEYLSVMVHFYRAEVHRSTLWRTRLDATTNWAALTTAGMLSWAFADRDHNHVMLLLSSLIVFVYMVIEARRFRRFEVYWARVRMLEENLISPVVSRRLTSPMNNWRDDICSDLNGPTYKSTMVQAMGFRLRRNYAFIFAVILGAWLAKLGLHEEPATSLQQMWERMAVGVIPPWAIASAGLVFYVALAVIFWLGRHLHGTGPVDEVAGVEANPERWKF